MRYSYDLDRARVRARPFCHQHQDVLEYERPVMRLRYQHYFRPL